MWPTISSTKTPWSNSAGPAQRTWTLYPTSQSSSSRSMMQQRRHPTCTCRSRFGVIPFFSSSAAAHLGLQLRRRLLDQAPLAGRAAPSAHRSGPECWAECMRFPRLESSITVAMRIPFRLWQSERATGQASKRNSPRRTIGRSGGRSPAASSGPVTNPRDHVRSLAWREGMRPRSVGPVRRHPSRRLTQFFGPPYTSGLGMRLQALRGGSDF